MNFLVFLFAGTLTSAMPVHPRLKGCWAGTIQGSGTVEIIFSDDKTVADGLYFERDKTRTLADFSCSQKLPAICTLFGDAGKFELSPKGKDRAEMKFKGHWVLDNENPDEVRVAIKLSKKIGRAGLAALTESACKEKQKELSETFGVGP